MDRKESVGICIEETKVVAIIRGVAPDVCARLAGAYRDGGIRAVEVAFDQCAGPADAVAAIKSIKSRFHDMFVGAGTVLSGGQLDLAIDAGAEFVVMPNCDPDIIHRAAAEGLVTMPGAFTPTEMVAAYEAGADYVKVFPARSLGPAYVRDVLAPLKHLKLIAVGGVSPDNALGYIKAGCVAVGASGSLVDANLIAAGEYGKIAAAARRLVEACTI